MEITNAEDKIYEHNLEFRATEIVWKLYQNQFDTI